MDNNRIHTLHKANFLQSQTQGEADEATATPMSLWAAVPKEPTTLETKIHIPPKPSCNNCLRIPIENTPGLGEGVSLCHFWSSTLDHLTNFTGFSSPQKQCAEQSEAVSLCLEQKLVPDSPVRYFGSPQTHFRGGQWVWKGPTTTQSRTLQGWVLLPPGGGKDTVHTSVHLDILPLDQNPCPRPKNERQNVEWALFHSNSLELSNQPGKYEVLDSGSFWVRNGKPTGKRASEEMLHFSNFTGKQALSLWVKVEFDSDDDRESSQFVLIDNTHLTFIGECNRECLHCNQPGSCLDTDLCRCNCNHPWIGKDCSECSIKCAHGTLTSDCECECDGLWQGELCETCSLDCGPGGRIDERSCECHCRGAWERGSDGTCSVCDLTCQHKTDPAPNAECMCDCEHPWVGDECETCGRECIHGQIEVGSCECECEDEHWEGGVVDPTCKQCNRDCEHRGPNTYLRMSDCTCVDCPYPWTGQWCEVCSRQACQHGFLNNGTFPDGRTHRDSYNVVKQSKDQNQLDCYGELGTDCGCCCDSVFGSLSEDPERFHQFRFSGGHCEILDIPCPAGTQSEKSSLSFPGLTCQPCLGNWEGRMCDECNRECSHGTTNNNPHCRCYCESGWRHGDSSGSVDENGQCTICEPRGVSGPVCDEKGGDPMVGLNCHYGIKSNKYSGKCAADEHMCTIAEIRAAYEAGWTDNSFRRFHEPTRTIKTQNSKCFNVDFHCNNGYNSGCNFHANVYLHIKDENNHVISKIRHSGGWTSQQTVCLPVGRYWVALCGGYGGSSSNPVRLVGGSDPSIGRVEIQHNGEWGTICDDHFGWSDANVICKSMGFSPNARDYWGGARYGQGSGSIWLDDLSCSGSESSVDQCGSRGWGVHDCGHGEDISVYCHLSNYWSISNLVGWTFGSSAQCSQFSHVELDLSRDDIGWYQNDIQVTEPVTSNLDGSYSTDLTGLGALCCKNDCTGGRYCDGYNCHDCPTCPSGQYSTCRGQSRGTCIACGSCAPGQTYVASECGGHSDGCVYSDCASTPC